MTALSGPRRLADPSTPEPADADADARLLATARRAIAGEAAALLALPPLLGRDFCAAARALAGCRGHVVVTGLGKSYILGQKLSATLASLGTPSFAVHAADLVHGDLGRIAGGDVAIVLSLSGRLPELPALIARLGPLEVPLVAVTGERGSPLALAATWVLAVGSPAEAEPLRLAPTSSSAAMLAIGDALALCAAERRAFGRAAFASLHPGGSLGEQLWAEARGEVAG